MTNKVKPMFLCALLCASACLYAAPVELIQGTLKLVLYPETGGFSLQRLSTVGKNRYEPLFDDRNSGTTSFFSVQANGRVFKLTKKIGKPVAFEQNGLTARYTFTLTDDFQVIQDFSFIGATNASVWGLKIDTVIENTSGKAGTFALKALLDTNLGESVGIHFTTDVTNRISSESAIDSATDADRYLRSANEEQSLVIPLDSSMITKPEITYIANWDRLNTLSWKPEYIPGRSFNTVYSVNDSAVLFVWSENRLEANESASISFVLGPETNELIEAIRAAPYAAAGTVKSVTPKSDAAKKITEKERNEKITTILARIQEIEANPASASDKELEELNAALDSLLQTGKD